MTKEDMDELKEMQGRLAKINEKIEKDHTFL